MKRKGLLLVCLLFLAICSLQSNAFASKLLKEQKNIGIYLEPKEDKIEAKVGETGKLSLGYYENIELIGTYKEITDNPYFRLNEKGEWQALSEGETSFVADVTLSDETISKLKEAYPDRKIVYPAKAPKTIVVKINPLKEQENIGIYLEPKEDKIEAKVGETGKLSLGYYKDIELIGTYKEITDNPYFRLNEKGEWQALSEGETSFVADVTLSDETISKLKEIYPDCEIVYPAKAPKTIVVKINPSHEKVVNTNIGNKFSDNNKGSGEKIVMPVKKLPQTGENTNSLTIIIGFIMLLSSLAIYLNKTKKKS